MESASYIMNLEDAFCWLLQIIFGHFPSLRSFFVALIQLLCDRLGVNVQQIWLDFHEAALEVARIRDNKEKESAAGKRSPSPKPGPSGFGNVLPWDLPQRGSRKRPAPESASELPAKRPKIATTSGAAASPARQQEDDDTIPPNVSERSPASPEVTATTELPSNTVPSVLSWVPQSPSTITATTVSVGTQAGHQGMVDPVFGYELVSLPGAAFTPTQGRIRCNVGDCGRLFATERGWKTHAARCHPGFCPQCKKFVLAALDRTNTLGGSLASGGSRRDEEALKTAKAAVAAIMDEHRTLRCSNPSKVSAARRTEELKRREYLGLRTDDIGNIFGTPASPAIRHSPRRMARMDRLQESNCGRMAAVAARCLQYVQEEERAAYEAAMELFGPFN